MAPGTISPSHGASPSDVGLTSQALEHKLGQINGNGSGNHAPGPARLDASKLIFTRTKNPRPVPDEATAFSEPETVCTDHMIYCTWDHVTGWSAPELRPYGPISLMPTASVLHYATECFEGLKAYRGHDGRLRLFRPDCNARRFLASAARVQLPAFDPAEVERLLLALMAADGPRWLPRDRPGSVLYLRPALVGTQASLGVQPPRQALLFATASFLRPVDAVPGGLELHTSPEDIVRAWPGGFGYAKTGANYGPSLPAIAAAGAPRFGNVLWLHGPEGYCTETGASNFFVVWADGATGRTQVVTAPLDDGLVLDGVTRRSLLQLARERLAGEVDVVERRFTIDEVLEAEREGRLIEAFSSGTAYFVTPVSLVHHRGKKISFGMGDDGQGGKYMQKLKNWMKDIMYGSEDHPWGVVVPEEI